jgi:L-seryl-tRNA(Ser) seleniumtransferase
MIATPLDTLAARARQWQTALSQTGVSMRVVAVESTVGGGSLPGQTLPTWALALDVPSPDHLAGQLRRPGIEAQPPVVARIEDDRLLLDPRTVLPEQDAALISALRAELDRATPD